MAAGRVSAPGTKYGPCRPREVRQGNQYVELNCGHIDCQQNRLTATAVCLICGKVIGYEEDYYQNREEHGFEHALCAEEKVERERKGGR